MKKNPLCGKRFFLFFFLYILLRAPDLFAEPPLNRVSAPSPRLKVLAAAEAYQGTPYKYAGLDKRGLDCSGLVYLSFRDALEVSIPRTTESLYAWSEHLAGGEIQAGDLLFFTTAGTGAISHVGIYAGNGRFIHSASEGPRTGVIYSYMSEDYWRRNYAGTRRVLPVDGALPFSDPLNPGGAAADRGAAAGGDNRPSSGEPAAGRGPGTAGETAYTGEDAPSGSPALPGSFLVGFGMAPAWGAVPGQDFPVRGAGFQIRFAWNIPIGKFQLSPGAEFRPEWDSLLGVFRFPLTLSLGWGDLVRVFLGPALTLGDPVIGDSGEGRRYSGGNSWLGIAGISTAPFAVKAGNGTLSLYAELVWQSFLRDPAFNADLKADVNAALKFSTGIRYSWEL
jgi:probable lipoprotein NlpC